MKPKVVVLSATNSGFTDDKDEAKRIRVNILLPAMEEKRRIILDFSNVASSTQSFIHALIGEVLQKHKEDALDKMEFAHCSALMKSLIELVVDYSLGGFKTNGEEVTSEPSNKPLYPRKGRRAES
jgi:STAS-like domain of unknown function (DUF4325)